MDIEQYRKKISSDGYIEGGSEAHLFMHGDARSGQRVTAEINAGCHTAD